ncbi:MAG: hypothetical protein ACFBSE_12235 [Prochloraceae cyanobacterium]
MSLQLLQSKPKFVSSHRQFDGDRLATMFGKFLFLGDNGQLGSRISINLIYWNDLGRCLKAMERPTRKKSGRCRTLKTVPI